MANLDCSWTRPHGARSIRPGLRIGVPRIRKLRGAIAAYFEATFEMQLVVSALTALVAFVFLRPFALKMGFSGNERLSGVDALLGRECIVTQDFDPASVWAAAK